MKRLIIAGTHSGVGKTTVSIGLMLLLKKKGFIVQPFKVGPDYIDPSYHTFVCDRTSRNLDSFLLSRDAILEIFDNASCDADISIIEGVMGLYDGYNGVSDIGSTADVAKILDAPVILIIDGSNFARSAGALALGYKNFDKEVKLKGIIFTKVSGKKHFDMLKSSVENIKLPVLGCIYNNPALNIPERHLGLIPMKEKKYLNKDFLKNILSQMNNFDIDRILSITANACNLPKYKKRIFVKRKNNKKVRIAVAYDSVFNFYYEDNFEILKSFGANLIFFSTLKDKKLPDNISGLYLGGGFPEIFAKELSANNSMKEDIKKKIDNGLPTYAECGGLMYLSKTLVDSKSKEYKMIGCIPGKILMTNRLINFGYKSMKVIKDNILAKKLKIIKGHEFHYSIFAKSRLSSFAYEVLNRNSERKEGFVKNNLLASYIHLHFGANLDLAKSFVESAKKYFQGVKNYEKKRSNSGLYR